MVCLLLYETMGDMSGECAGDGRTGMCSVTVCRSMHKRCTDVLCYELPTEDTPDTA